MAVGCGAKCAKFLLIVFNIVFWLSGVAILGVGIWLRVDKDAYKIFDLAQEAQGDSLFETATYVLIGIGAFVFLVGFLGCCGAIKESKCMLGLYIFFLVIVFIVELAAGILAAIYKDKIKEELKGKLSDALNNKAYFGDDNPAKNPTPWGSAVNFAQAKFKCCGFEKDNGGDYVDAGFNDTNGIPFPFTCCKLNDKADWENAKQEDVASWGQCKAKNPDNFYSDGCYTSIMDWIESNSIILIGVGIGIACLEIFGFIFAICLCRNTGED